LQSALKARSEPGSSWPWKVAKRLPLSEQHGLSREPMSERPIIEESKLVLVDDVK
jgi:hypothetical protein